MSDTGKDSQQQQDLKPRFIAVNLDLFSHAGMHGTFPSRSAAEPAHGGNLGGECAQVCAYRTTTGLFDLSECILSISCVAQMLLLVNYASNRV